MKRYIHADEDYEEENVVDEEEYDDEDAYYDDDDWDDEDPFGEYLNQAAEELGIFEEPSVQNGRGADFFFGNIQEEDGTVSYGEIGRIDIQEEEEILAELWKESDGDEKKFIGKIKRWLIEFLDIDAQDDDN